MTSRQQPGNITTSRQTSSNVTSGHQQSSETTNSRQKSCKIMKHNHQQPSELTNTNRQKSTKLMEGHMHAHCFETCKSRRGCIPLDWQANHADGAFFACSIASLSVPLLAAMEDVLALWPERWGVEVVPTLTKMRITQSIDRYHRCLDLAQTAQHSCVMIVQLMHVCVHLLYIYIYIYIYIHIYIYTYIYIYIYIYIFTYIYIYIYIFIYISIWDKHTLVKIYIYIYI